MAFGAGSASHSVDQTWNTHQVSTAGGVTADQGSVTGAPFGAGTVIARTKVSGTSFQMTFTEKFPGGTVTGTIAIGFTVIGPGKVSYSGHGSFTGGTGMYRNASGSIQSFTGTNSGKNATLKVKGTVSY
jgi:hypothetical protein